MTDERQVAFDSSGSLLHGVVYTPAHPSGIGVVICNPLFEERKSAGRVLVDTARALTRAGHCVLHFDYRGCGDSDGSFGAFTLDDWADDIRAAVVFLQSAQPCETIGLLGLRIGAALALQHAAESGSFVVAWEPVYDGRSYLLDELRKKLIKEMVTFGHGRATRESIIADLEAGISQDFDGYELSPALYESLCALSVQNAPPALSAPLLCLQLSPRPKPPDAQIQLVDALTEKGICAQQEHLRQSPFWNLIGLADCPDLIALTRDWIRSAVPSHDKGRGPAEHASEPPVSCGHSVDIAVGDDTVRGFLHTPDGAESRHDSVVVFLHGWTGCRHGPHRMFVKCARRLAESGTASLRIDFRGRGSSDGAAGDASIALMIDDARAAIQWLRDNTNFKRISLLGICSGGKVAIGAAVADAHIEHLLLWSAEPLAPLRDAAREARRSKSALKEYARKLVQPQTWRKLLKGQVHVGLVKKAILNKEISDSDERSAETGMLEQFRSYNGEVLFVYGGNDPDTRVAAQRYQQFCIEAGIPHDFHEVADANHSFYALSWEEEVIHTTTTWLAGRPTS